MYAYYIYTYIYIYIPALDENYSGIMFRHIIRLWPFILFVSCVVLPVLLLWCGVLNVSQNIFCRFRLFFSRFFFLSFCLEQITLLTISRSWRDTKDRVY